MPATKNPQDSRSLVLQFLKHLRSPQRVSWADTYRNAKAKVWPKKSGQGLGLLEFLLGLPFKLLEFLCTLLADLADRAGQAFATEDTSKKYGWARSIVRALLNIFAIPRLLVLPITSPIKTWVKPFAGYFKQHPLRALTIVTLALFVLFALGTFIFTGGALPAALGFLLFLQPMMGFFIASAPFWIVLAKFAVLALAVLEGMYLAKVITEEVGLALTKYSLPKNQGQDLPLGLKEPQPPTSASSFAHLDEPRTAQKMAADEVKLAATISAAKSSLRIDDLSDLSVLRAKCVAYYNGTKPNLRPLLFLPDEAKGNVHHSSVFKGNVPESTAEARNRWMQLNPAEVIQRSYAIPVAGSRDQFSIDVVNSFCRRMEGAKKQKQPITQAQQALLDAVNIFSLLTQIERHSQSDVIAQARAELPPVTGTGRQKAEENLADIINAHEETLGCYYKELQGLLEKIGVADAGQSPVRESKNDSPSPS